MNMNVAEVQNSKADANKTIAQSRLKKACAEFESIFINYMLKNMRNAGIEDGLFGDSNESKIMNAMFDENLAGQISLGGGMGIGDILFERMKDRI